MSIQQALFTSDQVGHIAGTAPVVIL